MPLYIDNINVMYVTALCAKMADNAFLYTFLSLIMDVDMLGRLTT